MSRTAGRLVVALTGGIGSGKSAAADSFARLGADVIDADAIAHQLTGPGGAAMPALVAAFGPQVAGPDGALDRAAMRQRAFADPAERQRLEGILHPLIRAESDRRLAVSTAPYALLVIPLLVESGRPRERAGRIAVVDCRPETQVARVIARSGLGRAEAERIIAVQATRAQRLAIADDVIDNEGTLADLEARVAELDGAYRRNIGAFPSNC